MQNERKSYVIGDIHGCIKTLRSLLFDICVITPADRLIFLGDYIDRGPKPKEVVELIIKLENDGYEIIALKGNHEQMLIDSVNQPKALKNWLRNGAVNTLDNFEIMSPGFLDDNYLNFFLKLKPFFLTDDFAIVHGGFNFDIKNPYTDTEAMIWSRPIKIDKSKIGYRKMIVGHTPTSLEEIKQSLSTDVIRLDGGCVYHRQVKNLGYLCAYELSSRELYYLENCD